MPAVFDPLHDALPEGFELRPGGDGQGCFLIRKFLGAGGFGIGYLAYDTEVECEVFIKEHFPRGIVKRDPRTHGVALADLDAASDFEWSSQQFVHEGRTLAKFRTHENIVTVLQTFRANGTAYMVTSYEEGRNLNQFLRDLGRPPQEDEVLRILRPILRGLAFVHASDYLHRDIAADNIIVCSRDSRPLLIDFGSSRHDSGSLTVAVKPKYAPLEYYSEEGLQGPWSDIYSLGAVAYKMLTGELPPEATDRLSSDNYTPLFKHPKLRSGPSYSEPLLKSLDWALELEPERRPQSAAALLAALPQTQEERAKIIYRRSPKLLLAMAAVLVVGAAASGYFFYRNNESKKDASRRVEEAAELKKKGDWIGAIQTLLPVASGSTGSREDARVEIAAILARLSAEKPDISPPGTDAFAVLEEVAKIPIGVEGLENQFQANIRDADLRNKRIRSAAEKFETSDAAGAVNELIIAQNDFGKASGEPLRQLEEMAEKMCSGAGRGLRECEGLITILEPAGTLTSVRINKLLSMLHMEEQYLRAVALCEDRMSQRQYGQATLALTDALEPCRLQTEWERTTDRLVFDLLEKHEKAMDDETIVALFSKWGEGWERLVPFRNPKFPELLVRYKQRRAEIDKLLEELEKVRELQSKSAWGEAMKVMRTVCQNHPSSQIAGRRLDELAFRIWDESREVADKKSRVKIVQDIIGTATGLPQALGVLLLQSEILLQDPHAQNAELERMAKKLIDTPLTSYDSKRIFGYYKAGELYAASIQRGSESGQLIQSSIDAFQLAIDAGTDPKAVSRSELRICSMLIDYYGLFTLLSKYATFESLNKTLERLSKDDALEEYAVALRITLVRLGLFGGTPDQAAAVQIAKLYINKKEGIRWWPLQGRFYSALWPQSPDDRENNRGLLDFYQEADRLGHYAGSFFYYQIAYESKRAGFTKEADVLRRLKELDQLIRNDRDAAQDRKLVATLSEAIKRFTLK